MSDLAIILSDPKLILILLGVGILYWVLVWLRMQRNKAETGSYWRTS